MVTASLEHKFNSKTKLTNTFRYGNYGFNYRVTAPILANDSTDVPPPGTPLDQILVYRDRPSSSGTTTLLMDRLNLNTSFNTGSFKHDLATGIGLSRETMTPTRYEDQINEIPATSLLNPNPQQLFSVPQQLASQPGSKGDDVNLYALDTLHLTEAMGYCRRFEFRPFHFQLLRYHLGQLRLPKPIPWLVLVQPWYSSLLITQSYYFSYGTSYNPAIQYLTLAPATTPLSPQKTTNLEIGGKIEFDGRQAFFEWGTLSNRSQ